VAALRRLSETDPGYPPVVFVYRGTPEEGKQFFDKHWPAARAIGDLTGKLYETFGIHRATLKQAFGSAVIRRALEALRSGIGVGLTGRDVMRMPGLFLIRKPEIIGTRKFAHVGDNPNFAEVGEWVKSLPAALSS
jgi:hypothetical protein